MSSLFVGLKSAKVWCACTVAATSLVCASYAQAAPLNWSQPYTSGNSPDSPLLFNFNESSGSVGVNEGTAGATNNGAYLVKDATNNVASGAGIPAAGYGNALNLTGTNYFSFPGINAGNVTSTGYAIEAWFKLDSVPGGADYGYLVNDYDPSNPAGGYPDGRHYSLSIHNSGGNAYLDFAGINSSAEWAPFNADDVPVSIGKWHHALVQYVANTGWEMYLDGDLKKTLAATSWTWTSPTTPNTVYVGTYGPTIGLGDFLGQIDSVRISNTSYEVNPVPEPASLSVLMLAGLGLVGRRRRS